MLDAEPFPDAPALIDMKSLLSLVLSASALAQVQVNIPLPQIRFEVAPPLVDVQPGVQVVPDSDDEVFSTDGWFWLRRGDGWYRTRDLKQSAWVVVPPREVPPVLVKFEPGRYRRFHPTPQPPPGVVYAPPPPQGPPAPEPAVQAKKIKAGRVFARVIYCKELHAKGGRVARHIRTEGKQDWGGDEIKVPELRADTIYAKEIHADWIEADEANCKEVKVGR